MSAQGRKRNMEAWREGVVSRLAWGGLRRLTRYCPRWRAARRLHEQNRVMTRSVPVPRSLSFNEITARRWERKPQSSASALAMALHARFEVDGESKTSEGQRLGSHICPTSGGEWRSMRKGNKRRTRKRRMEGQEIPG